MIFGLIALLSLALPHDAMAWGAGIHLTLGTAVLDNLSLIRPSVAGVIAAYPYDFLYGCIAADITIGKKFTHFLEHCHRWRIGVRVLEAASSPSRKACAYGYLSHLAADTVAHNYYVPYKIMRSFSTLTLKHTYWEMRFENFVDDEIWDVGRKVAAEHFSSNDALLRNVVSETLFSFGTNKRIFNSILLVSRLDKWRQVLKTLTGSSRYALEETDRDHYMGLAREAVFDFLLNEENAACFLADPTGEKALKTAEAVRKNLRFLYRTGKLSADQALEQLDGMKEKLRQSINTPGDLMEVLSSDQSGQRREISRL